MLSFLTQTPLFFLATILVIFLPGYSLLCAISARKKIFSDFGFLVSSIAASIVICDFLMLTLGAFGIPISKTTLLISLFGFSILFLGFSYFKTKTWSPQNFFETIPFSKRQTALVTLILALSVLVRTAYLQTAILPSSTDLGHHMYWSQYVVKNGSIPNYQQRDIEISADGTYQIGKPKNISDFIIGEHLIFAAISLISGISMTASFPIVVLFFIDMATILAIFVLTLEIFRTHPQAKNIAIFSLLLLGPIFALTPPQAKFVGGGVIGNLIGNLLMIIAIYFFVRFLREKTVLALLFFLLFSMGLFYTHHLTALLFLLSTLMATAVIFGFLLLNNNFTAIKSYLTLLFSPWLIAFLLFAASFTIFIYTPTYITNKAVDTVVGGPKKADHTGLAVTEFKNMVGQPRFVLGFIGLALLLGLFFFERRRIARFFSQENFSENLFGIAMIFSWISVLSLIALFPALIRIDIPSSRVANYATFPLSILASYLIVNVFSLAASRKNISQGEKKVILISFTALLLFIMTFGYYDNNQNSSSPTSIQKVVQTFHAANFLAQKKTPDDNIIKDHVYTVADSWIKLYFMKDYNYPLYRANFDRYENGIDKQENCTLNMISYPASDSSKKCYADLSIDYAMVNEKTDGGQFVKDNDFWKVYTNTETALFYKKK